MTTTPILLTLKEVAAVTHLSETTVKNLIRRGELASVKIGASRRVHIRALDEFIESVRDG